MCGSTPVHCELLEVVPLFSRPSGCLVYLSVALVRTADDFTREFPSMLNMVLARDTYPELVLKHLDD